MNRIENLFRIIYSFQRRVEHSRAFVFTLSNTYILTHILIGDTDRIMIMQLFYKSKNFEKNVRQFSFNLFRFIFVKYFY